MGDRITICPANILESGIVSVTGDPDAGFPEARLFDRSIDFLWKRTATAAVTVGVNQAADPLPVDFLAVAAHNFAGRNLAWQYSDNGLDWTDAVAGWTQADDGLIVRTLPAPLNHPYWQLLVSSMTNPQCAEVFMGPGFAFSVQARNPPGGRDLDNVQWNRTVGGSERSTKFGDRRRRREYSLFLSPDESAQFDDAIGYLDQYSRPFFLADHTGQTYLARIDGVPDISWDHKTHTHISINLLELL